MEETATSLAATILSNGIKLTDLGADHSERMQQLIARLKLNASRKDTVIHLEGRVGALDLMGVGELTHLEPPNTRPAFWVTLGRVMPDHNPRKARCV